ncbi:MAG: hypothetical protein UV54_C0052G0004 [Candidatus Beckwithbacteria bacterium GW2011_GWA2_43_10]|uniref:Uncharacterized protein n=1 Tax=Candidatus Beckwithbacteria bacterium GW2011_GWA2_43_10 TaxID=1618369 RepID=A0A0G1BZX5_9BACT|nr:MAG: hypothetical protein UV54_C0052G0004 [Candidatus Beckwithbacteria bacterium GW2011_GWA2_43_10]
MINYMVDVQPLNLSSDEVMAPAAGKKAKTKLILWLISLVFLGTISGYGLTLLKKPQAVKQLSRTVQNGIEKGRTFGVIDEKAFKDQAEGEIASGGIDGEGSHHLIRDGGESQYVYLTSSIVDLNQFVGKKVRVWGQTFEAQRAGWLMDVGRLEILE